MKNFKFVPVANIIKTKSMLFQLSEQRFWVARRLEAQVFITFILQYGYFDIIRYHLGNNVHYFVCN